MSITCPVCQSVVSVPQPPTADPPAHPALSIAASQARHAAGEAAHSAAIMSRSYAQSTAAAANSGPPKTSGLAIASMVCSLTICPGFIPGIICGHLARRQFKRDPSLKGAGMATAGLILGYFTLAFGIGFLVLAAAGVVHAFKKGVAEASAQFSNSVSLSVSNSAGSPVSGDSLWTLNLTTAQFPDQAAAGKIHGQDFTIETALSQTNVLILRQGDKPPYRQFRILTYLKIEESLANRTFDISPANSDLYHGTLPQIHMGWKKEGGTGPQSVVFRSGYALKLQFGALDTTGKMPAKIYLCLPDAEKSYVAGTFDLQVEKPGDKPRRPKKPPAN